MKRTQTQYGKMLTAFATRNVEPEHGKDTTGLFIREQNDGRSYTMFRFDSDARLCRIEITNDEGVLDVALGVIDLHPAPEGACGLADKNAPMFEKPSA